MLVPGVGSRLVTVAEDLCRSRRICSWGWCGGSDGVSEGGGGRIEYEEVGVSWWWQRVVGGGEIRRVGGVHSDEGEDGSL